MSVFSDSSIRATDLPVFRYTSSQCVAEALLAYTFLEKDAVGSSDTDGYTKTIPGMPHGCGLESRRSFPNELGTVEG